MNFGSYFVELCEGDILSTCETKNEADAEQLFEILRSHIQTQSPELWNKVVYELASWTREERNQGAIFSLKEKCTRLANLLGPFPNALVAINDMLCGKYSYRIAETDNSPLFGQSELSKSIDCRFWNENGMDCQKDKLLELCDSLVECLTEEEQQKLHKLIFEKATAIDVNETTPFSDLVKDTLQRIA